MHAFIDLVNMIIIHLLRERVSKHYFNFLLRKRAFIILNIYKIQFSYSSNTFSIQIILEHLLVI